VGLVYLVSGFGGSVLSVLFIRNGVSVGASGALFGLLGAMLSELITNWTIYTNRVSVSSVSLICFSHLLDFTEPPCRPQDSKLIEFDLSLQLW
jgi:membrane associated rhomboid family serine protease